MSESIVAQIVPYLSVALMLGGTALGLVALFHIIDGIERRAQPKPRKRA